MPRGALRDWDTVKFRHLEELEQLPPRTLLDGGWSLWCSYRITVDDPATTYLTDLTVSVRDGRLVAREVAVRPRRKADPPVTGAALRSLPIDSYVQRSLRAAAKADLLVARIRRRNFTALRGDDRVDEIMATQRQQAGAVTQLGRVVACYRDALRDLDPAVRNRATAHVAETLHLSRGHVSRLVTQARRDGLLGPAARGKAGELRRTSKGRIAR